MASDGCVVECLLERLVICQVLGGRRQRVEFVVVGRTRGAVHSMAAGVESSPCGVHTSGVLVG